jgi:allantoate deiminase
VTRLPKTLVRAEEVRARCEKLATFSETQGATQRTFLSSPMRDCHLEITKWLSAAGAKVNIDAAGNLRGYYAGAEPNCSKLLIGSHLDTVPNAGAYDGVLGVVIGAALLESLEGRRLPFGIEVIGFSEEEGVRFGTPFIGSRALVGRLDEELLSRKDRNGITVRGAIEGFGLNPEEISLAAVGDDVLSYLEFHIEQGPVLESLGGPLGMVEAIAAQRRAEVVFAGRANHAGTTPMHLRHDALAGAAEWVLAVERIAKSEAGLVATVGQIEGRPGATNVIPGTVRLTLDVRHGCDEICTEASRKIMQEAEDVAARRGLKLSSTELLRQSAVKMDTFLATQIEQAMRTIGCEPHRMVSGAGHDAMILAEKVPVGMVFLRSPGGVSHDPAEAVTVQDVEKALECGWHLLEQLAGSSEFRKRTSRA